MHAPYTLPAACAARTFYSVRSTLGLPIIIIITVLIHIIHIIITVIATMIVTMLQ